MREIIYNSELNYNLLKYMYFCGVYSTEELMIYVDKGNITKEEFKMITRYSYDGLKDSLEKNKMINQYNLSDEEEK